MRGQPAGRKLRIERDLPDDAFDPGFEEEAFVGTVKEAAVMRLLRDARISQGKAAELLDIDRHELLALIARHDIPAIDLTPEELAKDVQNLRGAMP